jgi:hypothetical protein
VAPPALAPVPGPEFRVSDDELSSSDDEQAAIAAAASTTHDRVRRRMIPANCKA